MEKIYFEETQHFQWGFLVLLIVLAALFGTMFLAQVIFKIKIGSRPAPSWLLFLVFLLMGAFTGFMASQKLKLKITDKSIYFSLGAFVPMQSIKTDEIASIYLRKYDGLDEFSGWGNKTNGKEDCYTTSGDYGIEITFKKSSRKSILIGTHTPKQVQEILSKYFSAFQN